MDIKKYFTEINTQKQINKLIRKYKNKKIIIYGAGEYFQILDKNYDLSGLNIIAICDKKFETNYTDNIYTYKAITPQELRDYDYDLILMALLKDIEMCNYVESEILLGSKNENKEVIPIVEPTLWYVIKMLFKNDKNI